MDVYDGPRATVHEVDGALVMDDPDALGLIIAIEKHNCRSTLLLNTERVIHFITRMAALGKTVDEVVIVIINVDDPHGGPLADMLMPGTDWQAFRDVGEVPFARGLADRDGIHAALMHFDEMAAEKLTTASGNAIVVVVDRGVAEIFEI